MKEDSRELLFLRGGDEYFDFLIQSLDEAKRFIHVQLYILGQDETGMRFLRALERAVVRGVKVFLLLDDFGTDWFKRSDEDYWSGKGITILRFSKRSTTKNFRFGRRLHSKIVVIDNELGMLGGMNFADRYSGWDGQEPWLDFAVAFRSSAVKDLNDEAAAYWKKSIRNQIRSYAAPYPASNKTHLIRMNDWLRNKAEISKTYRDMIRSAESEVHIIASYFLPGGRMLRIMRKKAAEGVKLHILLSAYSDVPFIKSAMEYYYNRLLKLGVIITEWPESILHAKVIYTDRSQLCIGSYNLNQLSDFSSLEANILIQDPLFVKKVHERLTNEIYPRTAHITKTSGGPLVWLRNWFSFALVRLGLRVVVFFSGRKYLDSQSS